MKLVVLRNLLILVSFFQLNQCQSLNDPYLCTEQFCENYREEVGCPPLDIACVVQNSTHNGRIFPSPTECNCCKMCLVNLKEGEFCSIGTPGSPLPTKVCGPHLYCTEGVNGNAATCQPMKDNSKCYKDLTNHDRLQNEGKLGSLRPRPICDGDGKYSPIICVPGQNCFCVTEEGDRIFGDGLDSDRVSFEMKCECSRMAASARTLIDEKFPIMTARCDASGSYDELQCTNDMCFCTEKLGSLRSNLANITTELNQLPCYNRTLHRHITSMKTYLRPCEMEKLKTMSKINDIIERGTHVIFPVIEECQPDGWYLPVRETKSEKYCSDPAGNVIESYKFLKTDPKSKDMNCKCARAREFLLSNKALEVPECAVNGNYPPATCRRGVCYCLDENGLQSSEEVPFDEKGGLSCCQNGVCEDIELSR